MRTLVVGGTGFIGRHVCDALRERGCDVTATGAPSPSGARAHPVLLELGAERDYDVAFLLAWDTAPGQYETSEKNLSYLCATLAALRTLADRGCRRFVVTGTCLEYAPSHAPLREDSPIGPNSLYAASKVALHTAARAWAIQRGVTLAWPRIFFLFGPGEHEGRLLPGLVRTLLRGEVVKLRNPNGVKDFMPVEDVASAIAAVGLSDHEGPVNICTGQGATITEVAAMTAAILGRGAEFVQAGAPSETSRPIVGSNRVLHKTIGWQPRIGSLHAALETYVPTLATPRR